MKTAAFAITLLIGTAAFAQVDVTAEGQAYEGDGAVTTVFETEGGSGGAYVASDMTGEYVPSDMTTEATAVAAALPAATDRIVEPSNADPERDARGIAVISAAAVVPAGWNGTAAGEAMGGPELDAVSGEAVAPDSYPACTATVTDKCLQTYEVGRG
jgi:hypothetical protein